ncbi:flagellar basal body-associated FliL family protein [Rhizobium sp. RU20A]|uniref:flagellar basal body-associated FliL family protein n=1 Tax=Rhizobium sp. RU20A TaxID=1907412 RepID=UPI00122D2D1B|nr:flagellar basal body-associated FliL family protein [Rhizobium sp. RU20A]
MSEEIAPEGEVAKKKSSPMVLIGAVVVLTLIAAGGGWMIGGMVAPKPMTKEMADAIEAVKKAEAEKKAALAAGAPADAHGGDKKEEGLPKAFTEAHGILQLDPITTNLAYPTENWIRLELALAFKGEPDVKIAEAVQADVAAYLRTVSLQQIQGPRGFQYLRDDIQERVDLRSEGRITNVIFRTFVIQ